MMLCVWWADSRYVLLSSAQHPFSPSSVLFWDILSPPPCGSVAQVVHVDPPSPRTQKFESKTWQGQYPHTTVPFQYAELQRPLFLNNFCRPAPPQPSDHFPTAFQSISLLPWSVTIACDPAMQQPRGGGGGDSSPKKERSSGDKGRVLPS